MEEFPLPHVVHPLHRTSFFSVPQWAAYSEFVLKRYPWEVFGRLLGVANVVFGVVGLLVYAFAALTFGPLGGSFYAMNVALTLVELCTACVPLWFWVERRKG
jgi:hypothetical protein